MLLNLAQSGRVPTTNMPARSFHFAIEDTFHCDVFSRRGPLLLCPAPNCQTQSQIIPSSLAWSNRSGPCWRGARFHLPTLGKCMLPPRATGMLKSTVIIRARSDVSKDVVSETCWWLGTSNVSNVLHHIASGDFERLGPFFYSSKKPGCEGEGAGARGS